MPLVRTVQQVLQIAKEHEDMDPSRGLQLINEAHSFILGKVHLVPDATADIELVADQAEYSLPDGCIRIWDAAYFSGESSHEALKGTNTDTLFYQRGANNQLQPSGVPNAFYERGGMVGFSPAPASSTVGGYPIVRLFYTPCTTLTALSALPTTIPSVYPWVFHMCIHQAGVSNPKKVPFYQARFEQEMKALQEWVFGRVPRDKPRVASLVPRIKRA